MMQRNGAPVGLGQIAPGRDLPNDGNPYAVSPASPARPSAPPPAAQPAAANQQAMMGALGGQPPPPATLGYDKNLAYTAVNDLQARKQQAATQPAAPAAPTSSAMGAPPAQGGPPNVPPGTVFGNLSDPTAWMNLVHNPDQLSQWVHQGLGPKGSDDLVNYYMGKIQGQPGANPTEQAGSAAYWQQKLQNDPNVTGRPAAGQSAGSAMNPMLQQLLMRAQQGAQPATAAPSPTGQGGALAIADQGAAVRNAIMQQLAMSQAIRGV